MKSLKGISLIAKVCGYISGAAIIFLMLLIVADVVLRRFFSSPIIGATEMAELAMVIIFVGVALTTLKDKHVKVDTVMDYLPAKVQAVFDTIMYVLTFCFLMWLGLQAYQTSILKGEQIYSMLKIPVYPFLWVVAASFFFAGLVVLKLLINKAREVVGK